MSTETPPTPDLIAEMVSDAIDIYGWATSWHGNVVSIGVSADDDNPGFRAVVVEGEQTPIVLERPVTLEKEWDPADEVRSWVSPDLFVVVNTMKSTNVGFLTPVEARRLAARLAALADEAEKLAGEEIARRRAESAQAQTGGAQ